MRPEIPFTQFLRKLRDIAETGSPELLRVIAAELTVHVVSGRPSFIAQLLYARDLVQILQKLERFDEAEAWSQRLNAKFEAYKDGAPETNYLNRFEYKQGTQMRDLEDRYWIAHKERNKDAFSNLVRDLKSNLESKKLSSRNRVFHLYLLARSLGGAGRDEEASIWLDQAEEEGRTCPLWD